LRQNPWEADSSDDGIITIDELYQYIELNIARDRPEQHPHDWPFNVTPRNIEIARKPKTAGRAAPPPLAHADFFRMVRPLLSHGRIIPFLGLGVYGSGSLSPFKLSQALTENTGLKAEEQYALATAAEYLEHLYGNREHFLLQFRDILEEQSDQCGRMAIHDLILDMEPPWLVVSATYDRILESRLEDEGRPYVLVAHILRSSNDENTGKILVVRPGEPPSANICLADQVQLEKEDCIIYKVLGAPFLHDFADFIEPGLDLDTVVVTETDHITFMSRLENQYTQVPTAFSLPLRRRSLLFLGYTLDVWHYRLVGRVFGKSGFVKSANRPYAVRQPTSPMEELFWSRLDPIIIPVDSEAFAQTLRNAGSAT
jgi:hypothetical protein